MTPKFYLVGGAVRDLLLGQDPKDRDYVVVGATPEWMEAQGYKQVGASFPVFLHPETGDEYALARTERKTAPGYHGFMTTFDPTITLEDDLARRDLTINAMAIEVDPEVKEFIRDHVMFEAPVVIDPFNGQDDLRNHILRHTTIAFADDPLRVLRLARFAARYNFTIAPETIMLAKKLVCAGELETVAKERIWTELYKGFSEKHAEKMVMTLSAVGALYVKPLNRLFNVDVPDDIDKRIKALEKVSHEAMPTERAIIGLGHLPTMSEVDAEDLKVPSDVRRAAMHTHRLLSFSSTLNVAEVLMMVDAKRKLPPGADDFAKGAAFALTENRNIMIKNTFLIIFVEDGIKTIDMKAIVADGDKAGVKDRVYAAKAVVAKHWVEIAKSTPE